MSGIDFWDSLPITYQSIMDFLTILNPIPEEAREMNLDDSEEEIECEENMYSEDREGDIEIIGEDFIQEPDTVPTELSNLPSPPFFQPFYHPSPEHGRQINLPNDFAIKNAKPISFFNLLFTGEDFETLAINTNSYAISKNAGEGGRRRWRPTNAAELMIFIGLIIYMGVFKSMRGSLYWGKTGEFPVHEISNYMSQQRFEQLKRYFHVSPVSPTPLLRSQWTKKLEPLASNLQRNFQKYIIPASNVAVDEMMIRFSGRSKHTVIMRSKPIPKGYKVFALCERGYTYSFMFSSRLDSFSNLDSNLYLGDQRLSATSHTVFQLVMSLPVQSHRFILYCDNYFSNIPLFVALREYMVAACGTVRPNSALYPRAFKIDKAKTILPFNTVSGIVCLQFVLSILWQDKNLVRFLTTYHECTPENRNYESRNRRRPAITQANRQIVMSTWGNSSVCKLRMPRFSIDYNDHMGGVDIADQRRSYYYTQLRVCRNWMPIFFWLLDTSIINAFFLAHDSIMQNHIVANDNGGTRKLEKIWAEQGFFRIRLAWNLVTEGFNRINPNYAASIQMLTPKPTPVGNQRNCPGALPKGNNSHSRRNGYVGKHFQLSPARKVPGNHTLQRGKKRMCLMCRYLSKDPNRSELFQRTDGPQGKVHYTNFECAHCQVPLCKFCIKLYHGLED